MRLDTIVGYTYNADEYCPDHILAAMGQGNLTSPENVLDKLATMRRIDRYDERSYDSGDFPKVIFADQVTDEDVCGICHEALEG